MKSDINSVIERVVNGDDQAFAELCLEYEPLIRSMSLKYAHMADAADEKGAREDFSQEATLALYRAAMTYKRKNGEVSFGLYAKVCIRNALVSELRKFKRKRKTDIVHGNELKAKQQGSRSSAGCAGALPGIPITGLASDGDLFSPFEKEVFKLYADGMKVRDIAKALGKSSKAVSNAVYRIKTKVRLSYKDEP